jgi:hypothetical protein
MHEVLIPPAISSHFQNPVNPYCLRGGRQIKPQLRLQCAGAGLGFGHVGAQGIAPGALARFCGLTRRVS